MASREEEAPVKPSRPLDDEGQATENVTNDAIVVNIPDRVRSADEVGVANAAASTGPDEDVDMVTDLPPTSATETIPESSANLSTADLALDIVQTASPSGVPVTTEEFDLGVGTLRLTTNSVLRSAPFTDATIRGVANGNALEKDTRDNPQNFPQERPRAIALCDFLGQLDRLNSDLCAVVEKVVREYLETLDDTDKDGANPTRMEEMLAHSVREDLKCKATHSGSGEEAVGNNKAVTTKKREGEKLEDTEAKKPKTSGKKQLEVEQHAEESLAEEPAVSKILATPTKAAGLKKSDKENEAKTGNHGRNNHEQKHEHDDQEHAFIFKRTRQRGEPCKHQGCLACLDRTTLDKNGSVKRDSQGRLFRWCHCPLCEDKDVDERESVSKQTSDDHEKAWGRVLECENCKSEGKRPARRCTFRDAKKHNGTHPGCPMRFKWTPFLSGHPKPTHEVGQDVVPPEDEESEDGGDSDADFDADADADAKAGNEATNASGASVPTPGQAQLDRDFPNAPVPVPTPGTNRLCGLYALRNSIAQLSYATPGLAVPTIEELVGIFFHPDFRALMRANGRNNNADLTADQVAVVLGRWAERRGIGLQLGVVGHGIEPYLVPVPDIGIRTVVWIHHNGLTGAGAHWSGLATMERDWTGMMAEADEQSTDDIEDDEEKAFVTQLVDLLPGTTMDAVTAVYAAIFQSTPSASYDDRLAMAFEFLGVSASRVEEDDVEMNEGGQGKDERIVEDARTEDVEGEE